MTLQEILFKNREIPQPAASRSVRGMDILGNIKCHDGKQSEIQRDVQGMKPNERRVLNILRRYKRPMTSEDIMGRLSLSKSCCNNILVSLCELGKAKRKKNGFAYEYEAVKIHGA